jgi:hypothetical protein
MEILLADLNSVTYGTYLRDATRVNDGKNTVYYLREGMLAVCLYILQPAVTPSSQLQVNLRALVHQKITLPGF